MGPAPSGVSHRHRRRLRFAVSAADARNRLFDLAARYRFIWLRTTVLSVEMLEDKHVQHQTLVDAILARDAEQASALMREHLLTSIPIIQQAMAGKLSPQAG